MQESIPFDHRKLEAYRIAVGFRGSVHRLLIGRRCAECRDQLRRAASSVVLNIAEGAGRRGRGEKRQFYAVARASAQECSAVLDILLVTEVVRDADYQEAQAMLLSIVRLLSRMVLNLRE